MIADAWQPADHHDDKSPKCLVVAFLGQNAYIQQLLQIVAVQRTLHEIGSVLSLNHGRLSDLFQSRDVADYGLHHVEQRYRALDPSKLVHQ